MQHAAKLWQVVKAGGLPAQVQWWSNASTQRWQAAQWRARSGCHAPHASHQRPGHVRSHHAPAGLLSTNPARPNPTGFPAAAHADATSPTPVRAAGERGGETLGPQPTLMRGETGGSFFPGAAGPRAASRAGADECGTGAGLSADAVPDADQTPLTCAAAGMGSPVSRCAISGLSQSASEGAV